MQHSRCVSMHRPTSLRSFAADRYGDAVPVIGVNGIACYHEDVGTGEPVLLLHGGFCSIETMRAQVDALSQRYRVLAPERPGHGRSPDREAPITYDGIVSDTVAYLDERGIDRCHVIGFSDGAIAGYLLALRHPSRVRSLVAISGNLDPSVFVPPEQMARAMPEAAFAALAHEYDLLSPDGSAHREEIIGKVMRMWREEPHIDPRELAAVTAPTLIMAGDHDVIRTDHTILISSAIQGSQLCIVPNASHMVMLDRPELVNLVLQGFLAELPSS